MFTRKAKSRLALAVTALVLGAFQTALAQDTALEQPSLYDRLGGLAPISVVVSDFIDVIVPDPVLNRNPAIDAARKRVPAAYLKYQVTALVCQATGGPCRYQGRAMKDSHVQLNITEHEWDRMLILFKQVLAEHEVPTHETQELLGIVDSTKADIVASRASE